MKKKFRSYWALANKKEAFKIIVSLSLAKVDSLIVNISRNSI